jgi:two-component system chemotaxis response regulator CheB
MSRFAPGSISVLIVEDSRVLAELLQEVLSADPAIRVVGVATDGEQAIEAARRLRPAVITMDIHMPRLNGLEATRRIMETCPTPIVIVSGSGGGEGDEAGGDPLHAVAAGALASMPRPNGVGHPEHAESARQLVEMVKLMSEVKVVRRWPRSGVAPPRGPLPPAPLPRPPRGVQLVAIGASTGGPPVLQTLLRQLPRDLAVPLLIVQHMSIGFAQGFSEWLADSTGFPVHLAVDGEVPLPGHAYVAPDDRHMGLRADGRLMLSANAPENGVRPAVSFLLGSIPSARAPHVVAVLLTGMGRDGVDELKRLHDAGAMTIAQDEKSSVVFGMPGQAVKAGAVSHVLAPELIAGVLANLVIPS